MQMIGENHNGVDIELTLLTSRPQGGAEKFNMIHKDFGAPISKRDGEEKSSAGDEIAPIADHAIRQLPVAWHIALLMRATIAQRGESR